METPIIESSERKTVQRSESSTTSSFRDFEAEVRRMNQDADLLIETFRKENAITAALETPRTDHVVIASDDEMDDEMKDELERLDEVTASIRESLSGQDSLSEFQVQSLLQSPPCTPVELTMLSLEGYDDNLRNISPSSTETTEAPTNNTEVTTPPTTTKTLDIVRNSQAKSSEKPNLASTSSSQQMNVPSSKNSLSTTNVKLDRKASHSKLRLEMLPNSLSDEILLVALIGVWLGVLVLFLLAQSGLFDDYGNIRLLSSSW